MVWIGSVLHYCSSADKQLKVDKMGVLERISVGTFAVNPKGKVPQSEIIQESIFPPSRLNPAASEVVRTSAAHDVGMGTQVRVASGRRILNPMFLKSSTGYNFEFIGWRLPAILEYQSRFDNPIIEHVKFPFWDSKVGPKLALSGILSQNICLISSNHRLFGRCSGSARRYALPDDRLKGEQYQPCADPVRPCHEYVPPLRLGLGITFVILGGLILEWRRLGWIRFVLALELGLAAGWLILIDHKSYCGNDRDINSYYGHKSFQHDLINVAQKHLTYTLYL